MIDSFAKHRHSAGIIKNSMAGTERQRKLFLHPSQKNKQISTRTQN